MTGGFECGLSTWAPSLGESHRRGTGDGWRYLQEFIIRFRLSALLVLVTALAVLLAVINLDERSWTEVTAVDAAIASALTEIGGSTRKHFGIDRSPRGAKLIPAYPFTGSRVSHVRCGVLLDSNFIERQIVVPDMVDVTIKISSDWRALGCKPHVTVEGNGTAGNAWFLGSLQEKLREYDAVVETVQ
ncbi:MAG: hypothetical protein ACTHK7_20885 [Aureliella sp.]